MPEAGRIRDAKSDPLGVLPDEEVKTSLAQLGMGPPEARAYMALTRNGPLRAGELAKALGITRQDAYRILHRMVERGFVASEVGHPAAYRAVPTSDIVAAAVEHEMRQIGALRRADASLGEALARLRPEPEGQPPTYRLVQGRAAALGLAAKLAREARERLLCLASAPAAAAMLETIEEARASRDEASLPELQVIVAEPMRRPLRDPFASVRMHDGAPPGALIVSDDAVLLWLVVDPSARRHASQDVAFWSDAAGLARTQALLFGALWAQAAPVV